jgi:anti-sigma factor ChrR (cupin superfamily)
MIEFDDLELPLAQSVTGETPSPDVKMRLMARIRTMQQEASAADTVPAGFSFTLDAETEWQPHPVPGIRMKLLSVNRRAGYVTLLLDVAPGTRFPEHHHSGAEECYVISGTLEACGRTIGPGDFHHADGDTDHGELFSATGCRVLLVVPPEDYFPAESR